MIPPDQRSWYYFGCDRNTGHRLLDKNRRGAYIHTFDKFDGQLCPKSTKLYIAIVTRIPHLQYTALAWWDQTVDTRPGSNSIIFAPSLDCTLTGIRHAMTRWFPWVEARLPQPLIIIPEEQIYDKGRICNDG